MTESNERHILQTTAQGWPIITDLVCKDCKAIPELAPDKTDDAVIAIDLAGASLAVMALEPDWANRAGPHPQRLGVKTHKIEPGISDEMACGAFELCEGNVERRRIISGKTCGAICLLRGEIFDVNLLPE